MTDTAKDTGAASAPQLSWTRTKEWGSAGSTYRAESDGWKFTCDQPQAGAWAVRGWGPDDGWFYADAKTLKASKALAEDRLASHQADLKQAASALVILPAITRAAVDGMDNVAVAIRNLTNRVRRLALRTPQPCGCPTPTHRMSCGIGGRVMLAHPTVVLADEGAAILKGLSR